MLRIDYVWGMLRRLKSLLICVVLFSTVSCTYKYTVFVNFKDGPHAQVEKTGRTLNPIKYWKYKKTLPNDSLIAIEGVAQDAKAGAVIIADNKDVYYINGIDSWQSKYLNKRLAVTGVLVVVSGVESNDSILVSQSQPLKKIIKKAEYRIIK
jgi:hypothetical protein